MHTAQSDKAEPDLMLRIGRERPFREVQFQVSSVPLHAFRFAALLIDLIRVKRQNFVQIKVVTAIDINFLEVFPVPPIGDSSR